MKTLVKQSILVAVIMASLSTAANAQNAPLSDVDDGYGAFVSDDMKPQVGTADLQEQVLMEINASLANGTIAPDDAANWKTRLNTLNRQESWYKSVNKPIPQAVVDTDKVMLVAMEQQLRTKQPVKAIHSNDQGSHCHVNESIADALAHNKISSSDAEKYYLRVAEQESTAESLKSSGSESKEQTAAINNELCRLKAKLTH